MPTLIETLRERVIDWALGPEKQKLQEGLQIMLESQRYAITPESLIQQLGEVDSHLLDVFLQQSGYQAIIGQGGARRSHFTEQQRLAAVDDSRYMFHNDVMIARAVKIWTDFGFGQRVQITPRDGELAAIWNDFWHAPANDYILSDREVHQLSEDLTTDGEQFFAFFISTLDGACTIRTIATERILRIETEPGDPKVPLYYVENNTSGEIWYPDWRATRGQLERRPVPEGARLIDTLLTNTQVVVLHAAFEKVNGRGWPMFARALAWARAYRNFLQDRATVAKAVATYVDNLTVRGGSRQVEAIRGQLASALTKSFTRTDRNPGPAAGSTWLQNDAVNRERLPLGTGAGDAQTDGMTIASQVAVGTGTPLHFIGRPDAMQNRAVARESGMPFYEQIQRYQTFWASILADMVRIVSRAWELYNRSAMGRQLDPTADILLDSPFDADIAEIASMMGQISSASGGGQLDEDAGRRANAKLLELALTALGVRDPQTVTQPADAADLRGGDNTPDAVKRATEKWLNGQISDASYSEFMSGAIGDAAR